MYLVTWQQWLWIRRWCAVTQSVCTDTYEPEGSTHTCWHQHDEGLTEKTPAAKMSERWVSLQETGSEASSSHIPTLHTRLFVSVSHSSEGEWRKSFHSVWSHANSSALKGRTYIQSPESMRPPPCWSNVKNKCENLDEMRIESFVKLQQKQRCIILKLQSVRWVYNLV